MGELIVGLFTADGVQNRRRRRYHASMDHIDEYGTHLRASGLRPRSIRLRLDHARSLAAHRDPAELTPGDVEAWLQPDDGPVYAPATLRSRRASARCYLGWLHDTGRIDTNPASPLRQVRVPDAPPRAIPDAVFARAMRTGNPRDRAALMLGRYACLRLNEIAELRIEDRDGERLRVQGKGGTVRLVWITPSTQAALDELADGRQHGYYFPGRFSGHIHREALHKIIKRATGGWNPHSLRHAGATAAYRGTRNLRAVQAMLGHANLSTTQRYLTVDEDEMRALARAALGTAPRSDDIIA